MVLWWLGLVSALGSVALASCPQHCSCFTDPDGYVSANCSVEALSSTQDAYHVEMLNFQPRLGGYPTHLAPRVFVPFRSAKFLWMVNCSVLDLPSEVFHGLIYVIRLDLSYNKIRRLNGAVFEPMKSLTTLKLRSNPIELTPWDAIVSDSLQELDLGQCGLRIIPFGTFASLPRLSRLYLDGNHLRVLTYSTVAPNLRYVNLAKNRISEISTPVLTSLSHLRKIDLSKNPVNCTCNLLLLQDWLSGQGILFDNGVTCVEPSHYKGMQLSKVNEYELCSMEEVQRQRRINEIRSFRDSKQHRVHNMIRDPDVQSDQPHDGNNAEVLFDSEDGLTHMEMNKHFTAHDSDISGENNKVAESEEHYDIHDLIHHKEHESSLEFASIGGTLHPHADKESSSAQNIAEYSRPTDVTSSENHYHNKELETSKEFVTVGGTIGHVDDLTPQNMTEYSRPTDATSSEHHVFEEWSLASPNSTSESQSHEETSESHLPDEWTKTWRNETTNELSTPAQHDPFTHIANATELEASNFTTDAFGLVQSNASTSAHDELADEGYSPVYNMSEIMISDEAEGSGDESVDLIAVQQEHNGTSTVEPFTFPSPSSELADYSYDSQHDYSGEVTGSTTESMVSLLEEEGSGEPENETYVSSSSAGSILWSDESSTEPHHYTSSIWDVGYNSSSSSEPTFTDGSSSTDASSVAPSTSEEPSSTTSSSSSFPSFDSWSSTTESSSSVSAFFPIISTNVDFGMDEFEEEEEESTTPSVVPSSTLSLATSAPTLASSPPPAPSIPMTEAPLSQPPSTLAPVEEVEILKATSFADTKGRISAEVGPAEEDRPVQSIATYVIAGLLVALILAVLLVLICKRGKNRKKVRLPKDTEAHPGTELQDMLLPRPAENGVKILPTNGKAKEEEEKEALSKDWDDKDAPIETVTARLSVIATPQTPVFIHKTLA